jgi:hypothetical protein
MTKNPMSILDGDRQESVQVQGSDMLTCKSRPDMLSGHSQDQDEKWENERAMVDYLTIQEAAKRCGVSDKTIQRAIRAGTLPARYPQPNRCEIAVCDLDAFKPRQVSGHVQTATESRLAALEARVEHLEHLVADLLSRQETPKPKHTGKARKRPTSPLPKQFVSLLAFARHHNVAQSKVQTHVDMGLLPVKHGEWTDTDGTVVTLALDAKGRVAFSQLYHGIPPFVACKHCPH